MKTYAVAPMTRIEFGIGQFDLIGLETAAIGSRAFVVLDPFLKGSALEARLDSALAQHGLTSTKWFDIVPNPRAETCDKAAALLVSQSCDCVVAIGGGSTIDAAKAISLVAVHGGRAWDYTVRAGVQHLEPKSPGLPIIAVPTSAGTGAEVTPFAVLSNPAEKLKATIKNASCAPVLALIDPELHVTKPPALTASTGVDTFLHAFEGYLTSQANNWTDMVALRAMELFAKHIRTACHNGSDLKARAGMAEACYLAGLSLANIGVGVPHSLGQALGALKDTPHGDSCAACLIPTIQWTLPEGADRLATVARIFEPQLVDSCDDQVAAQLPSIVSDLLGDIGLSSSFSMLGLESDEIETLLDVALANYGRGCARWIKPAARADLKMIAHASL